MMKKYVLFANIKEYKENKMQEKEMAKTILNTLKEIVMHYTNTAILLLFVILSFTILCLIVMAVTSKKEKRG